MVCGLCQKKIQNGVKIRRGYICEDCFTQLPSSIKENIKTFSSKHLLELIKILHRPSFSQRLRFGRIYITATGVQIDNWEINIKDIRNISLNFHPSRQGIFPNVCQGVAIIVIETWHPHFILEEPMSKNWGNGKEDQVNFFIRGYEITYIFSLKIENFVRDIQIAIYKKQNNFIDIIHKYGVKNDSQHQKKHAENQSYNSKKKDNTPKDSIQLQKAKKMYGIQDSFSEDDLTKIKRKLLKKYHPDINENKKQATEITKAILDYYDLLLPYTKK